MDLLSQALMLAPPNHLEEVLGVWQQCEAETMHLLTQETEAEERFNDAADRKLPGAFDLETITVQPRREVGRGAVEEAPMGLFDVARGAAAAFSKTAFPLRGSTEAASNTNPSSSRVSMDGSEPGSIDGQERIRRRDMVTNAATGALASGIGWMLGTPTNILVDLYADRFQVRSQSPNELLAEPSIQERTPVTLHYRSEYSTFSHSYVHVDIKDIPYTLPKK